MESRRPCPARELVLPATFGCGPAEERERAGESATGGFGVTNRVPSYLRRLIETA
jgi:acyl-CoA synthetase (AMP-forming)/AMP-acid ligase II